MFSFHHDFACIKCTVIFRRNHILCSGKYIHYCYFSIQKISVNCSTLNCNRPSRVCCLFQDMILKEGEVAVLQQVQGEVRILSIRVCKGV